MKYEPAKYPFVLTRSNQTATGMVESETTFEGNVFHFEDEDTQMSFYEVDSICTGFAQYQDGKEIFKVENIKRKDVVCVPPSEWANFEKECIDRALHIHAIKHAA